MEYHARHRDRRADTTGPRWRVYFPEDDSNHWLPWLAGPRTACIHTGLATAAHWAAEHGAAAEASTVARQLPQDGGALLPGILASLGRSKRRVAGNCAFHMLQRGRATWPTRRRRTWQRLSGRGRCGPSHARLPVPPRPRAGCDAARLRGATCTVRRSGPPCSTTPPLPAGGCALQRYGRLPSPTGAISSY